MNRTDRLWVLPDPSPPLSHVIAAATPEADVLYWHAGDHGRGYGRARKLTRGTSTLDVTVKLISPRLALDLIRHPASTVILLELDLAVVYAILSRLRHPRRRLVVLVEGDLNRLGPTGSASWKRSFRRILARFVTRFVANSADATRYLTGQLGVPSARIEEGWWLAGLPGGLEATPPPAQVMQRGSGPILLSVGRLTELKGQDRLLRAAAAYSEQVGPCRVWLAGEGESRSSLEALADDLGIAASTTFLGSIDHAALLGALRACDAFVFPTMVDLVGRALVEALATGTPVVVSDRSGAIGVLVEDGVNGVVIDPDDPKDILRGLREVTDAVRGPVLRAGANRSAAGLTVDAAAAVLTRALAQVAS